MREAFTIRKATSADDMLIARMLIESYMRELGEDLCFQGVDDELENLPGPYAEPAGVIFFATLHDKKSPSALIALKKLDDKTCEMKRLYVEPKDRGHGMGDALVKYLLSEAKTIGYDVMVLDTLARLQPAIALYERLGFIKTEAYNDTSLEGITYFQKTLK